MGLLAICALITSAWSVYGPSTPVDDSRFTFDVPSCAHAGTAAVDPIVSPGMPSAHSHQFFGTFPTADDNTRAELRTLTSTCTNDPVNRTSYWLPTAYAADGTEIVPDAAQGAFRAYYSAHGKQGTVIPWSGNLGFITDDVTIEAGRTQVTIRFPDCWNGSASSADHRSHMAFSRSGICPTTHPIPVPKVRAHVNYPESVDHWSVPDDDLHADLLNGWAKYPFAILTDACLNRGRDASPENVLGCTMGNPIPGMDYGL